MADDDAAGEAQAERGVGDVAERADRRVLALVDVEIEVEAVVHGERGRGAQAPRPVRGS